MERKQRLIRSYFIHRGIMFGGGLARGYSYCYLAMACLFICGLMSNSFSVKAAATDTPVQTKNSDLDLLNNRFRIDYSVEEVTLILSRKPGSNAAILVRPDGTKIYPSKLPKHIHWLETEAMDVISIINPMPGPWQALMVPYKGNRVQLTSNVSLKVAPIPERLYQGEKLVVSATMLNQGKPLDLETFLHQSILSISAAKQDLSDKSQYLKPQQLAGLIDDGSGFDAYPQDGLYTTQVYLDLDAGPYQLIISTYNEVFARAYRQYMLLYPYPFEVQIDVKDEIYYQISLDQADLSPEYTIIKGRVFNNVGWEQEFIAEFNGFSHRFELPNPMKAGAYRVEAQFYGTSKEGRDIQINMAEDQFVIMPKVVSVPPEALSEEISNVEEAVEDGINLWLFATLWLIFVLLSGGAMWWFYAKKSTKPLKPTKKAKK